jgi:hypothetical protein
MEKTSNITLDVTELSLNCIKDFVNPEVLKTIKENSYIMQVYEVKYFKPEEQKKNIKVR